MRTPSCLPRALVLLLAAGTVGGFGTVGVLGAAAASAETFSAPQLVSAGANLLVDGAAQPAVSTDGRYVAFTGSLAGVPGIYRKDLATGALDLVAAGDATAPSISADGRYVSFTTTVRLVPEDQAGACSSVYVRDMDLARGAPGSDTLVSALDGGDQGLTYGDGLGATCPNGGSTAASRVALSADGRHVVFTIAGRSNLETGFAGAATTPPDQVVVRDLDTQHTTLVSQTSASLGGTPQPIPGGAALATPGGTGSSTAAISADGSTVAWMGIGIPAQAGSAAGSPETQVSLPIQYDEPLWRRIADGPAAPTRRVTGGDDPAACPGCDGPLATGYNPQTLFDTDAFPHTGSYLLGNAPGDLTALTPQLDSDGGVVAMLSTQPTPADVPALTLAGVSAIPTANAYVVNMAGGLTRTQALTPLTSWASLDFAAAASTGAVRSLAISPDGTHVAFTTDRILFPLVSPTLVSAPLNQPGAVQLYDVDLAHGTFSRVSDGFDAQPANGDVVTPAFSGDDRTLVFASAASNLVFGVGAQSTSIFSITDETTPPVAGTQDVSPAPVAPKTKVSWLLSATVKHGKNGTVLVDASLPGKGTVSASARGSVPVKARVKVKVHGHTVTRERTVLRARTVASGKTTSKKAGVVRIALTAASRWDTLVRSKQGLVATFSVKFTAKGHKALTKRLELSFHGKPKPKKKASAKKPAATKKTAAKKRS